MNTNTWINFILTLLLWIFIWTFVSTLISMYKITNKQILLLCVFGTIIVGSIIYFDPKFTLE